MAQRSDRLTHTLIPTIGARPRTHRIDYMPVISRIDLRGRALSTAELRRAIPRAALDVGAATATVEPIIAAVREHGAAALRDFAERFDGIRPTYIRVPAAELAAALANLDPSLREALEIAAEQVAADPLTWVLTGGEDHALLATFPADRPLPPSFRRIGSVVAGEGVTLDGEVSAVVGWDHFGG